MSNNKEKLGGEGLDDGAVITKERKPSPFAGVLDQFGLALNQAADAMSPVKLVDGTELPPIDSLGPPTQGSTIEAARWNGFSVSRSGKDGGTRWLYGHPTAGGKDLFGARVVEGSRGVQDVGTMKLASNPSPDTGRLYTDFAVHIEYGPSTFIHSVKLDPLTEKGLPDRDQHGEFASALEVSLPPNFSGSADGASHDSRREKNFTMGGKEISIALSVKNAGGTEAQVMLVEKVDGKMSEYELGRFSLQITPQGLTAWIAEQIKGALASSHN